MSILQTADVDSAAGLQDVVDNLAVSLARSVALRSVDDVIIMGGPQRGGSARSLAESHLRLAAPGGNASLAFPIRSDHELIGHLMVATGGLPELSEDDTDAIDEAIRLCRQLIDDTRARPMTERANTMRDLLSSSSNARRAAYATSLQRRWLPGRDQTELRSLLIDTSATPSQRAAFVNFLSTMRPIALDLAGESDQFLILVGRRSEADLDALVREEGEKRGVRIHGIGLAQPSLTAEDLSEAAAQASRAAELSSLFDEFRPSVDVNDLGGWVMLGSVRSDPSFLKVISPAAERLWSHGDDVQRQTIEAYLDVGCQVKAACELLFIHRTTLYYRLEKMPEVVREALADGMKKSTLHLALKLIRLWQASGRV